MSFTANLDEIVARNENGLLGIAPWWLRARLKEVASILNGFPFESSKFRTDRGMPLLRIRDVLRGSTETFYDGDFDPAYLIERGDLVVGMDGDFNSARWRSDPALLNQRVCRLTTDPSRYSSSFLEHVLPGYLSAINAHTPSVTVKHLSSQTIASIPLPLPPLEEQRRLAEDVEKQFTRLEVGMKSLTHAMGALKNYRAGILKSACEGRLVPTEAALARNEARPYDSGVSLLERLREKRGVRQSRTTNEPAKKDQRTGSLASLPEGWTWASIDELLRDENSLSYGILKPGDFDPNGIPMLRVQDVGHGRLNKTEIFKVRPNLSKEFSRTVLESGNVLLAVMATVGRSMVVPDSLVGANVNRALAVLKLSTEISGAFVSIALRSPRIQNLFQRNKIGSAQPRINLRDLRGYTIPLPPIAEQLQIVSEVEKRISGADALQAALEKNLKRGSRLHDAILKYAFAGRLTPRDPREESAAVLLNRIQSSPVVADEKVRRTSKAIKPPTPIMKKVKTKKKLLQVLRDQKKMLTPEELFHLAGFSELEIDTFFEELKGEEAAGRIRQVRPDDSAVLLTAKV